MRAKERQKEDFSEFRNHSAPEVEQMDVDNDQQEAALPREEDVERMDEESEEENRLKGEGSLAVSVDDVDILDEDTVHSEIVWIRSLPWRLMLMPRRSHSRTKSLGIFLQCCPAEVKDIVPSTWYCHAVVEFSLERHLENQEPFSRRIEHTFCAKENDWGFPSFVSWEDMTNPDEGYLRDGVLHVRARIVADAPHGIDWDSKRLTGYVGLKNQGATCYMSSLLQTLFFTTKLRKAVYLIPSEMDDHERSVAFAMQRVFHELQFNVKPVATKKLTRSFGWDTWDSFMQHDIQELCRVLLDNLEQKMIGTVVEGTIPRLFEGKMESYVKCTQVDYTSSRMEPFMDVQLNIKGKKNIFESLDDYVASETLDGDNKYDAGKLGLQEAKKGVIFIKLPPILNLHLMRFQYDVKTESNVKINDRYEFPVRLDFTKYLKEPEDVPSVYKLFAVLVHSGDYHGGHYVAYLNPGGRDEWFKFDDDVVSACKVSEAVESNYGGTTQEFLLSRSCTSAYMLVYVRESSIDSILAPVLESDIPVALTEALAEEKKLEEQRRKDKREDHLYLNVEVLTTGTFHSHQGYELFDIRDNDAITFKFLKTTPFIEIQEEITEKMGYKPGELRLWLILPRQNSTHRPSAVAPQQRNDAIASMICNAADGTVFAETLSPDIGADQLPEYDISTDNLLFFKWYNPMTGILSFVTFFPVPAGTKFGDLAPALCSSVGLPEQTPLKFYEEVSQGVVELINPSSSVSEENEFQDGDIICFQKSVDPSSSPSGFPATVEDYFRELDTQITVTFHDALTPGDIGSFSLDLSYQLNYAQIASHVGTYLGVDPMHLQFIQPNPTRPNCAGHSLRSSFSGTLKDLVSMTTRLQLPSVLFYQKIPMRIDEYETKRQVHCLFYGKGFKETELLLFVDIDSTIRDVISTAKAQLLSEHNCEIKTTLRMLDIVNSRVFNIYSEDGIADALPTNKVARLEVVPPDEMVLGDDELLVAVAHFHKETFQTFGAPFCMRVKDREPLSAVLERIRSRLELSQKDFEKYKVALVRNGVATYYEESDGEEIIRLPDFKLSSSFSYPKCVLGHMPWIGLDHVNRNPKRNRLFLEKAIKIFN